jgi:hypothetical protein
MTDDDNMDSNATFVEKLILSAFPVVSTHLRHTTNHNNNHECSSGIDMSDCGGNHYYGDNEELFPHDVLLAALAVFYCRYTVYSSGEGKFFRVVWASLLAYLANERYSYWILAAVHVLSFGEYTWNTIVKIMNKKVRDALY